MASKNLFLARLLRPRRSSTAAIGGFPGSFRSLHSTGTPPPPPPDSDAKACPSKKLLRLGCSFFMLHPFLREGNHMMHTTWIYQDRTIVKVNMPGIGKDGLNLIVDGDIIAFEGVESAAEKEEDVKRHRIFRGAFRVPAGFYNTGKVKGVMQDGELKIVIPRSGGDDDSLIKACYASFELLTRRPR